MGFFALAIPLPTCHLTDIKMNFYLFLFNSKKYFQIKFYFFVCVNILQYAISKGNNEIIQLISAFMVGDFTIEKIQNELLLVDAFRHDDVNKLK